MTNKDILLAETKKIVRQANLQLNKLRKAGIVSQAKKIAESRIQIIYGKNAKGFRANKNMSYNDLEKTQAIAKRFLNSKTSTIKGIEEEISKRDKTFLTEYHISGRELSILYDILSSEEFKKAGEITKASNQLVHLTVDVKSNVKYERERIEQAFKYFSDSFDGSTSDEYTIEDIKKILDIFTNSKKLEINEDTVIYEKELDNGLYIKQRYNFKNVMKNRIME